MLMRAAADQLGGNIAFDEYRIGAATELGTALDAIWRAKPDALTVDNDPLLASKAAEIAAVKLPAISGSREFTDAGLLVTYGRQHIRHLLPRRELYRSHPQRRQTGRSAGRAAG
jgi:hypothetical protein